MLGALTLREPSCPPLASTRLHPSRPCSAFGLRADGPSPKFADSRGRGTLASRPRATFHSLHATRGSLHTLAPCPARFTHSRFAPSTRATPPPALGGARPRPRIPRTKSFVRPPAPWTPTTSQRTKERVSVDDRQWVILA